MIDFRKEGKVSVWVTQSPLPKDADFQELCGIEHYDADELEVVGDLRHTQSLEVVLECASYSGSFGPAATAAGVRLGIDEVYTAVLLYNFEFQPVRVAAQISRGLVFLGAFNWDTGDQAA